MRTTGSIADEIKQFIDYVRNCNARGLIVLSGDTEQVIHVLSTLIRHLARPILAFTDSRDLRKVLAVHDIEVARFHELTSYLGREYSSVIMDFRYFFRPNAVSAASEMIRCGGFSIWLTKSLSLWSPGVEGGRGTFRRYLLESLKLCRSILVVDVDSGEVVLRNLPSKLFRRQFTPEITNVDEKLRKVLSLCATEDQYEFVLHSLRLLSDLTLKVLVGKGDRGRGKSAALGLATALAIAHNYTDEVLITAPSSRSITSLMKFLCLGLEKLGIDYKTVTEKGSVVGIRGRSFEVRYVVPWLATGARLTVIDEAAAVGAARVKRLCAKSRKVMMVTTVHGYEGSGRVASELLIKQLPSPLVYEFKVPIRYLPNDPLEEWLYQVFFLRVDPIEIPKPEKVEYSSVDQEQLVKDRDLLRKVYGLLALAHYRNEPDDLMTMLDAPHHHIRILNSDRGVVAVAQIAEEGPIRDVERAITRGLRGVLVLDKLLRYGPREAAKTRGWRIVRIAVVPNLQRRGYGSKLLNLLEEEARSTNLDWIGAIFSRNDIIDFWLKNGYLPIYISPRFNKVTGEKNIAVIKPLSTRMQHYVEEALREFKVRLLTCLMSVYRDLSAEVVASVLKSIRVSVSMRIELTRNQEKRLEMYLNRRILLESAMDAIYLATLKKLCESPSVNLNFSELVAVIAYVLQGKPLDDVAAALRADIETAKATVDRAVRKLLS